MENQKIVIHMKKARPLFRNLKLQNCSNFFFVNMKGTSEKSNPNISIEKKKKKMFYLI